LKGGELKKTFSVVLMFVVFQFFFMKSATADFYDSGQSLGSSVSWGVALGDVDGDGDLDAFVVNWGNSNKVWLNDGSGTYADSGQGLGNLQSYEVDLGDVDGDGDLDAFTANAYQPNKVWLNDGTGNYTDSGQSLGSSLSYEVDLGDVDGDGGHNAASFAGFTSGIQKADLKQKAGSKLTLPFLMKIKVY
jgi:hypothetical protein